MAKEQSHEHPVHPERVAAARASQLSSEHARRLRLLLSVRARMLTSLLAAKELCLGRRPLRRVGSALTTQRPKETLPDDLSCWIELMAPGRLVGLRHSCSAR